MIRINPRVFLLLSFLTFSLLVLLLLPFCHSFQRQLNLYGFIRVDTGSNKGAYRHPKFIKGRKDLIALINRIKIKGNGRPRSDRGNNSTAVISDIDGSTNSNRSNAKETTKPPSVTAASAAPTMSVVSKPKTISGIAVILEAIKTKKGKESTVVKAPAAATIPSSIGSSNALHEFTDSICNDSNSNSTIPSTIDVRMKESSDTKNRNNGLSWRQNPSESFSDWTIEILEEGLCKSVTYNVHRRVLAVGPKKSDYFANIFKTNGSANMTQLRLSKIQASVFPLALDYIYADIDFDLDAEKAYAVSSWKTKSRSINSKI